MVFKFRGAQGKNALMRVSLGRLVQLVGTSTLKFPPLRVHRSACVWIPDDYYNLAI